MILFGSMENLHTEKTPFDYRLQRSVFGALVNNWLKGNLCCNCHKNVTLCKCYHFDDGNNGMLSDGGIV
jgi:hypothetical protein